MEKQLTDTLIAKYPNTFKTCRELQCGDGWFSIIETLCESFTYAYTTGLTLPDGSNICLEAPIVVLDQVKEKFATLRVYYHLEFDPKTTALFEKYPDYGKLEEWSARYRSYFDGVVHFAETLSSKICEETGLPGVLHSTGGKKNGWYRTLNKEFAQSNEFCKSRNYLPVV